MLPNSRLRVLPPPLYPGILRCGAGVGLHSCLAPLPSVFQAAGPGRLCPGFYLSRPTPQPHFPEALDCRAVRGQRLPTGQPLDFHTRATRSHRPAGERAHASRRVHVQRSPTWTPATRPPFALTHRHSADRQHSLQQTRPHQLFAKEGALINPYRPRPDPKAAPRVSAFGNSQVLYAQGYTLSPKHGHRHKHRHAHGLCLSLFPYGKPGLESARRGPATPGRWEKIPALAEGA